MNITQFLKRQNILVVIRLVLGKYLEEKGRLVEGIIGDIRSNLKRKVV
jgi:hypothetical protein